MQITNKVDVQKLVAEQIEERDDLEFKSSLALQKTDSKKKEITKDVSAFANSAGGTIIYGIVESSEKRGFAEKIDVLNFEEITKEWVEHIMGSIQPRIQNVKILPIVFENNHGVYVITIPKSYTAHQAIDNRYYRRYNFESVQMKDYEIRDIMGRMQNPLFSVSLEFLRIRYKKGFQPVKLHLLIRYKNIGNVYANYVSGIIILKHNFVIGVENDRSYNFNNDGEEWTQISFENLHMDKVSNGTQNYINNRPYEPNLYISRYTPILPKNSRNHLVNLSIDEDDVKKNAEQIVRYELFADNAQPINGAIKLKDIPIEEELL